ncbi:MAG: IS21-like element helper ATPase IstB [Synechococcaceae cyanobacterium]|nr:IS21-like element helper ATPase IstB [Synechococcaceae cyanobacterium]
MSSSPRNRSTAPQPPVPTEELEAMLTRLRLPAIRDRLVGAAFSAGVALLEEAARRELNLREALAWLCAAEIARKDQLRMEMALRLARFPYVRTLEAFDFEAQPSIDPAQIRELATCRWVANGDTLLLLGPPGVGKTHLAVALGREAVRLGHSVQYVTAMELITALSRAQGQGTLEARLTQYSKSRLLIIDELGYLPLEHDAAYLFFQLISRCYERGSVLITSNRPVMEWGEVFGDQVVATAILDRLLHHSHVLTIRGDSYRLREKRRSGLLRPQAGGSSSAVTGGVPPPITADEV